MFAFRTLMAKTAFDKSEVTEATGVADIVGKPVDLKTLMKEFRKLWDILKAKASEDRNKSLKEFFESINNSNTKGGN